MSDAPHDAFAAWYAEACRTEPDVPDAMQLATVDAGGRPSLRTVLLKGHGPDGLVFFTNLGSRKGRALAVEPRCVALFHWKSLQRQAIVEGLVQPVDVAEADAYFATRPRGSQVGAWASRQSAPLPHPDELRARVAATEARYAGQDVPRPDFWSGYRLVPDRWELWQGKADRLHERRTWVRGDGDWVYSLLYP